MKAVEILLGILLFTSCDKAVNEDNQRSSPLTTSDKSEKINQNLIRNEPWRLGCDTIKHDLSRAQCISESYHIADSMLHELFREQLHLLEHSNCNECREGLVERQIELAKSRRELFVSMQNLTSEYVGLEFEGGSIAGAMQVTIGREMIVNQINEMQSLLFPLRRAAGYDIDAAMGYQEVVE